MADMPGNVEWVQDLIPDLESRKSQFVVDTEDVDDELIEVFIEEIRRLTNELREGLSQKDLDAVRGAAHSIKGMGGTIGLPEISVLGLEVELMAKDDRLDEAVPIVEALVKWMETLG